MPGLIIKMLVIEQRPDGGRPVQIYDEEWFYAIRAAERVRGCLKTVRFGRVAWSWS